jgi:membrane protease YdiL (CAAX protease family)
MERIFPIYGRYIVIIWLLPFVFFPGLETIYRLLDVSTEWFWFDLIYYYYFHFIFLLLMALLFAAYKVNWKMMLSRADASDYLPAIKLTAFIFIFSIAAAYALFYPLSFVFPEFVTSWFIDIPPFIYSSQGEFPLIPNLLSFLSLVVFAPLVEEFAFRGILLHRWGEKYGVQTAIVLSSLLFGIAHPDPIGAAAFGVAMCILYLKTRTLWVPIFCHALTNLMVWCIEVGYISWLGPEYSYTLEDFRNEWQLGAVAALIVAVWGYLYLKGTNEKPVLSLPRLQ